MQTETGTSSGYNPGSPMAKPITAAAGEARLLNLRLGDSQRMNNLSVRAGSLMARRRFGADARFASVSKDHATRNFL